MPFFAIWTGQAFSLAGSAVAQFALVWWVTKLTGSATVLATATLVAVLPGVLLGPVAGAYVDRWPRRLVMMAADGVVALAALALAVLFWTGAMQVWHVYVVMAIRAIGSSFHWPAMQASTSLMVPREHLSRVAGLNQAISGVMNIVSPPLGALLLAVLPLYGIMLIDLGTALVAVVALFFVHIHQPVPGPAAEPGRPASIWSDVVQGLRYVLSWPGALLLLAMAMILNFVLTPAGSLVPLLVTKHYPGDALQLGWLESAFGVGVVAGGLGLGVWGGFRRRIYTSLTGITLMGVGVAAVGLAPASMFWVAVAGQATVGLMQVMANGPMFAILQSTVAPEYQGRVFTLVSSLSAAMVPLSLVVAGPLSDALGLQVWYALGGIVCAVMGIGAAFVPAIVHIEQNHRHVVTGPPAKVTIGAGK